MCCSVFNRCIRWRPLRSHGASTAGKSTGCCPIYVCAIRWNPGPYCSAAVHSTCTIVYYKAKTTCVERSAAGQTCTYTSVREEPSPLRCFQGPTIVKLLSLASFQHIESRSRLTFALRVSLSCSPALNHFPTFLDSIAISYRVCCCPNRHNAAPAECYCFRPVIQGVQLSQACNICAAQMQVATMCIIHAAARAKQPGRCRAIIH
jgi:hypothetical protein